MKEKDKQIIKDSTLAVVDSIVATMPPLAIAWGLSKAMYEAGLKLREQKALEWIEMIRDNPQIFTEKLLKQEEFQDGFVFALEKYIAERNEEKRKYYLNIFLGFSKSDEKKYFELERFYQVMSQLSMEAIEILPHVDIKKRSSYQVFDDQNGINGVHDLISSGILILDTTSRFGSLDTPYVYTTRFGKRFINYLRKEN